jgi:hypothetical protein
VDRKKNVANLVKSLMIAILLTVLFAIFYIRCSFLDVYAETMDCLVVKQDDFKNELLICKNTRILYNVYSRNSRTIWPIISGLLGLHHAATYISEWTRGHASAFVSVLATKQSVSI